MITAMFFRVTALKGQRVEVTMSWGARFTGTVSDLAGGETCDLVDWRRVEDFPALGSAHPRTTIRVADIGQIHALETK
jgi:hypothetical protein